MSSVSTASGDDQDGDDSSDGSTSDSGHEESETETETVDSKGASSELRSYFEDKIPKLRTYEIVLGESFFDPDIENIRLNYDFMPKSMWGTTGQMQFEEGKGVRVSHENPGNNESVHFRGFEAKTKPTDFVLVFKDRKLVIEKVHRKVSNLKRQTQASLASAPPLASAGPYRKRSQKRRFAEGTEHPGAKSLFQNQGRKDVRSTTRVIELPNLHKKRRLNSNCNQQQKTPAREGTPIRRTAGVVQTLAKSEVMHKQRLKNETHQKISGAVTVDTLEINKPNPPARLHTHSATETKKTVQPVRALCPVFENTEMDHFFSSSDSEDE